MAGERIPVRFMAVCGGSATRYLQPIDAEAAAPELLNHDEVESRFRWLVDSHQEMKQIAVFWETTSSMIACEAIKDSHRPRELIWLHRGVAEHIGQRTRQVGK